MEKTVLETLNRSAKDVRWLFLAGMVIFGSECAFADKVYKHVCQGGHGHVWYDNKANGCCPDCYSQGRTTDWKYEKAGSSGNNPFEPGAPLYRSFEMFESRDRLSAERLRQLQQRNMREVENSRLALERLKWQVEQIYQMRGAEAAWEFETRALLRIFPPDLRNRTLAMQRLKLRMIREQHMAQPDRTLHCAGNRRIADAHEAMLVERGKKYEACLTQLAKSGVPEAKDMLNSLKIMQQPGNEDFYHDFLEALGDETVEEDFGSS